MIRYLIHRLRHHRVLATKSDFLHYYHCWTCDTNWDGLLLRGGRHWTA